MKTLFLAVPLFFSLCCHLDLANGQESTPGDVLLAPALLYHSGLRTKTSETKTSYLVYETRLAYQVHPDFFLGLHYQVEDASTENAGYSSANLNNKSVSKRTSVGPALGYVTPSFHFFLSYFIDSKWDLTTTESAAQSRYNYTGNGFQIDLGYKIPLWGLFFGPQVSYKKFTYGNLSTDGGSSSSTSPQLEDTRVEPSLAIYYFF